MITILSGEHLEGNNQHCGEIMSDMWNCSIQGLVVDLKYWDISAIQIDFFYFKIVLKILVFITL